MDLPTTPNFAAASAAFAAALDATRDELAATNATIDTLDAERQRIETLPPHADEIAATLRRGVQSSCAAFERALATRMTDRFTGNGAAKTIGSASSLIGEVPATDRERRTAVSPGEGGLTVGHDAIVYLLRDRIAEEIPRLVDRLCPSAKDQMPQPERVKALQGIADELVTLKAKRDVLIAEIHEARTLANGRR